MVTPTAIHKLSSTFVHWIGQIREFMEIGTFFIPCFWPNAMAFFFVSLNKMQLLFLPCFYSENFCTQRKVSNFNFHSLYLWNSSILKSFLVQILCIELVLYLYCYKVMTLLQTVYIPIHSLVCTFKTALFAVSRGGLKAVYHIWDF